MTPLRKTTCTLCFTSSPKPCGTRTSAVSVDRSMVGAKSSSRFVEESFGAWRSLI